MEIKITPESLSDEIEDTLKEYGDEVNVIVNKAAEIAAEEAVKDLESTSPAQSGKYAKSWSVTKKERVARTHEYIVHNEKRYRLTHLLEDGHDIKRKGKNVGRAGSHPHIKQVEKKAVENFEKQIEKGMK